MVYDNLTEYERSLARFGDKCALIAGLEITDKITPEQAYQEIKDLYKDLKKLRKKERRIWGNAGIGTTKLR
jgi:hypothetical protein